MSNFNSKKYLHQEAQTSPWLILPFILTLTVVPFIMGLYSFDADLSTQYWHASSSSTDIFLHYKSFYLMIMGGIMALTFVIYRFMAQRKFSFGIAMIPIYVYIGCIILSTMFSTSVTHSIHGIEHHFEPTFVLLTYCMLVLYGAYFIDNERTLKWFINGFLIGVALLALFGVFQYLSGVFKGLYDNGTLSRDSSLFTSLNNFFGCTNGMSWYEKLEPFKTQTMANYVYLPIEGEPGGLTLNFPLGQVYMTLYNPNYVAYFTTLTAPFFAVLCAFQEKMWRKIVFGLVSVASIICLIGSNSLSGFISLGVSIVIIVVAFRKKIFKHRIPWLCGVAIFIVCVIGYDFASDHAIWNKVIFAKNKLISGMSSGYSTDSWFHLRNMTSSPDGIKLEYEDTTLTFTMDYDDEKGISCEIFDSDGKKLATKNTTDSDGNASVVITDSRYKDYLTVSFSESLPGVIVLPICSLNIDGIDYIVTNQIHTMSYVYNPNGNTNTPFTVMQKKENDTIGNYYYYSNLPASEVQTLFQSFITDTSTLKACFKQIGKITSSYDDVEKAIFSSDNPASEAAAFFNELLQDSDGLYTFFYYMTMSSDVDENYYFYNQIGKWTQIGKQAPTAIFENYPNFASGRGFIWSRSIPLMFKNVHNFLIGTGPDTFAINYPHYDYVNLYRGNYRGKIITKPHSLYLQIGVQTGFISMIAVLALYVLYLINCLKLYWKSNFTTFTSKVSIAILASVSGYMFSGITNDSTVTYSYVFWGMMGVGLAVNRLEKRQIAEEKEAAEREARLEQKRLEREEKKNRKQENTANA